MAMRDEDFGAALTPVEADDGHWWPPMAAPARGPRDWQSLYEAAHARAEELRRAERAARSRAGSLKWQLDKSRDKLKAAVEEVKEVRRAAKNALFYQAEVARLEKLLLQAGVESSRRSTIMSLRMEVFRLREALQASQARKNATVPRPEAARGRSRLRRRRQRGRTRPGRCRGRTPGCARRWSARRSRRTSSWRCAGRSRRFADRNERHRLRRPARAPGCARRWNGRGSRRTRSRRCAGKSVP